MRSDWRSEKGPSDWVSSSSVFRNDTFRHPSSLIVRSTCPYAIGPDGKALLGKDYVNVAPKRHDSNSWVILAHAGPDVRTRVLFGALLGRGPLNLKKYGGRVMKKCFWMVGIMILTAAGAGRAWGDKVECLWPEKPVVIDGRATEWSDMPVVETAGIAFRAMNDASNLYVLIRGANSDGRVVLSGRYRQNVTLWFLKPDHKSKSWGINLDFGRAHSPERGEDRGQEHIAETPTLATFGVMPEKVLAEGLEVSTATLPSEMEFASDLSTQNGRQPVYEIRIPLQLVERSGKSIYVDFVTSEISPDVKSELQAGRGNPSGGEGSEGGHQGGAGGSPSGGSGGSGGGRHKRGGAGGSQGGAGKSVTLPKPLAIHLTIALTKEPRH